MRICLVTSSYPRFEEDGNARFIRSIAEAQAALGHDVHVVAPYAPQVRPYDSPVHVHWFRYVWPARWGRMGHAQSLDNDRSLARTVWLQLPLFSLGLLVSAQRIIRRYRIDLIHAHWVLPSGVLSGALARFNRKPLFISLHGSDVYLALKGSWLSRLVGWAFRRAQGVTGCSQPLVDGAVTLGALPARAVVVPYGAEPSRFDPEIGAPEVRQGLGIASEDAMILAAGRLVAKKGFAHAVRAMPHILSAVPNARLVIIGEGPERAKLERERDALGLGERVHLPGAVAWQAVRKYLAACDVFVMPSVIDTSGNLDGLPNVILEAMAAGRPVVATRVGGIPLAVQDGRTGVLVSDANPEHLASALAAILTSPGTRASMGRAGRARIVSELNWMQVAHRIDQLYSQAA